MLPIDNIVMGIPNFKDFFIMLLEKLSLYLKYEDILKKYGKKLKNAAIGPIK